MSEPNGHGCIVDALAAAQGEFGPIIRDKTNPFFKSKYASLDSIYSTCRPVLSKHEIAIVHVLTTTSPGMHFVVTKLLWGGDSCLSSSVPVIAGDDMQSLGTAITYAKRYGLTGLLGVAADEDTDGNAASQPPQKPAKLPAPRKLTTEKKTSEDWCTSTKFPPACA